MRRVEPAHPLAAEVEHLVVRERARRAVGHVGEPDVAAGQAVRRLGVGRGGEPLVERAAFVALDMGAGRPAQLRERDHGLHRLDDQREEAALAVVEEQRLVGVDQELVEGEAGRADGVHEGREPVDAGGDFGYGGFHRGVLSRAV